MLIGLLKGSDRKDSDLVVQLSRSACKFAGDGDPLAGLKAMGTYIEKVAEKYDIGVFLNMDHLKDLDFIKKVVETGIPSSVMIDASQKPFEENVKISRKVKDMARREDILVESELGKIKGAEDEVTSREAFYTKPENAVEFVKRSGCDLLAISIGTQHGVAKGKNLDLKPDTAEKVNRALEDMEVPLVIHGSSGLLYSHMEGLVNKGVCKFNKDTRYQYEYSRTAYEFYKEHDGILPPEDVNAKIEGFFPESEWSPDKEFFDPRVVSGKIRKRIADVMAELTEVTCSAGKSLYK